ncbi:MAG: hypothetical protein ACP5R5_00480 [Armatimonadota bacterium]
MKHVAKAAAIALMLAFCVSALGQPPRPGPGGRFGRVADSAIFKDLGLSQTQIAKVEAIVRKYRADARVVFSSKPSPDEARKKIDALKSKAAVDIQSVLTPEQRQKAKKNGSIELLLGFGVGQHGRLMSLLEQLNLSAAQKTKIKAILDDSWAKRQAISDNRSRSIDQKRAKYLELRKQTNDRIMAVLTKDQKARFEKLLKERARPGPPGRPGPGPDRRAAKGRGV